MSLHIYILFRDFQLQHDLFVKLIWNTQICRINMYVDEKRLPAYLKSQI